MVAVFVNHLFIYQVLEIELESTEAPEKAREEGIC